LDIGTKSNNTRNAWRISGVNITLPLTLQKQLIPIIKPDFPTATLGQKITLEAAQSVGDNIVSYSWEKVSGNFSIENDNSRTATVLIPNDAKPGSSVSISLTI
jgi:K319-like protein